MTSCLIGLVYWKTIELYWPRAIWHIYQEKRNEYLRCFKEEHAGLSRDDLVKELNDVAWGSAGGKWLRELGGPFVCLTGVCTREGDLGKVGCNPKALKMKSSRRIIVWINLRHCHCHWQFVKMFFALESDSDSGWWLPLPVQLLSWRWKVYCHARVCCVQRSLGSQGRLSCKVEPFTTLMLTFDICIIEPRAKLTYWIE